MIEITLLGEPKSTGHIYRSMCRGKFASVYMNKEGKELKESYQMQAKAQYRGKVLTGEIDLRLELFFGTKRRSDIDNFNKLVLDACTGTLWEDDSQIQSLLIIKSYDKCNPRIELTIN